MKELEPRLLDIQYGFRPKRGIQDPTTALKSLDDEFRRRGRSLYTAFLDLTKAYDSVPRAKLFEVLRDYYKVDPELVRAIEALYEDTVGVVHVGGAPSASFPLTTGVRQGCLLSPLLFAAYMDFLLRGVDGEGRQHGVHLQYSRDLLQRAAHGDLIFDPLNPVSRHVTLYRCTIWCLLYADDIALLAASRESLQQQVDLLAQQLRRGGLVVSVAKSRVMVLGAAPAGEPPLSVHLGNAATGRVEQLEQVEQFKYLGTTLASSGSDEPQVKSCVGKAWGKYWGAQQVLERRRVPAKLRGMLFSIYVRSALLWDSAHWRTTPAILAATNRPCFIMAARMLGGWRAVEGEDERRRLPHADMRRTLGLAHPHALLERQQLRHLGRLLRAHRQRPHPVTMAVAGRLDPVAHPPEPSAGGGTVDGGSGTEGNRVANYHGTIISLIHRYTTAQGGKRAAIAFNRQRFGAAYSDAVVTAPEWEEIVQRPLVRARELEAACPVCQHWYDSEQAVRQHWRQRHGDHPAPAEFLRHET